MPNFNDVGRLGTDPEMKITQSGKSVTNFYFIVERDYKDSKGNIEVDGHPVEAWGKLAETTANNLSKGRLVQVIGQLQNNTYEDSTGKKVYGYKIVAERIKYLDYPKKDNKEKDD